MKFDEQLKKLKTGEAVVAVIGLGYVGLPLTIAFAEAGYQVIGLDIDQVKVDKLLAGESYIKHIAAKQIQAILKDKRFQPTTDFKKLTEADAICICVPTPLGESRDPDLSYVTNTCKRIAEHVQKGQLVILESTTYPGTTKEIVVPILESSHLSVDRGELYIAYSPEREDPGRNDCQARNIPKIIGGINPNSAALTRALYGRIVDDTVMVSSCEVAEAAKIVENIYRSVNIAMVNEMKMLFDKMDINIWDVINAAKTKPFGFQAFYPGPGLGGHCIPIDPFYLSWRARQVNMPTRFIELAGEINSHIPGWVIQKLTAALNGKEKSVKGSTILLLGVAYKKDVDDFRETPAFPLIEMLQDLGANVYYHDPYVPHLESEKKLSKIKIDSTPLTDSLLENADAVLIVTDHSSIDYQRIIDRSKLVIDTRNATQDCTGREGKVILA